MKELKWWQKAVFYQVYIRSFADGNNDGIGDFKGLISKLNYLWALGIDAIWLCPHYPSPNYDCGYDVSDYTAVGKEYGTMEDFCEFLEKAHKMGIRVVLDLLLNHTSIEHEWFKESRKSTDNPKRDWYIWKKPKLDGSPPNNWNSIFDGSAWELDVLTNEYYYHYYLKEMPDLNWQNREVRNAMYDVMRFWLNLGADGFRIDSIGALAKHPDFPDHEIANSMIELKIARYLEVNESKKTEYYKKWKEMYKYQADQPHIHEILKELRAVIDEFPDKLIVAENFNLDYLGKNADELNMVFNFPLMREKKLTPKFIRKNQKYRLSKITSISDKAKDILTFGDHDTSRVISRYNNGKKSKEVAKICLALMITLPGTPMLYYGEEIGMNDLHLPNINQFKDTAGIWLYNTAINILKLPESQALTYANVISRDKCRTPMQWDNSPNAGFCGNDAVPWLPVNPNFLDGINAEEQKKDPGSMLIFYMKLINARKINKALINGDYLPLGNDSEKYLAFVRKNNIESLAVIINFSDKKLKLNLSDENNKLRVLKTVFSTNRPYDTAANLSNFYLDPFEILIAKII